MDPDLLRLILLGLGVLLVVGIYVWDRHQRRRPRPPGMASRTHVEPTLGADGDATPDAAEALTLGAEDQIAEDDDLPPGEFVGEPVVLHRWDVVDPDNETQLSMDLEFNAQDESDYLHIDPALMDEVPRLIVQVILMSRDEPFSAGQVREAMRTVDMKYGEMNIYHRENERGQVLFSLASVVEPGTFPKKDDQAFSTPGLVMFTQLPGVQDGIAIYSDMLFTAERLVALLNAELLDETRSALTRQAIEHTREKILEHRRKIQLLGRRR
jgi:cell division protein ZipA